MAITVGPWWFWVYLVAGLIFLVVAVVLFMLRKPQQSFPIISPVLAVAGIVLIYLSIYAGTHFRVDINERALLIDTIEQEVIGVRESGLQNKPLYGAKPYDYPALKQFKFECALTSGVDTAVSAPPKRAPLFITTTFWMDLSRLDLVTAYRSYGPGWEAFVNGYLNPLCRDLNRAVAVRYTPEEHEEREAWEADYEVELKETFEHSPESGGFNIDIIDGRVVMAWDFANSEDAEAYDVANRSSNLLVQRENERLALLIEAEMVQIRSDMIVTTTLGTIDSLDNFSIFLEEQPVEMRPYLMGYLDTQVSLEYLRLVAQQEPDTPFPPGSSPQIVYDVAPPVESVRATVVPFATPAP